MAFATRGPGAACAANGVARATLVRFPLVLVADCIPHDDRGRVAHQRFDQQQLFAPITKWSGTLATGPDAAAAGAAAFRLAAAHPAGAVHLDYDPTGPAAIAPAAAPAPAADDDVVGRAAAHVAAAVRPVAIVGLGAVAQSTAVRSILERLGCPVLLTYQAAGVLPEGHPQLAGLWTNGVIEDGVLGQADLVLAVGVDLVEPMPGIWHHDVAVISVSESPAQATLVPFAVEVLGPLATTLGRVCERAEPRWPTGAGAGELATVRRRLRATASPDAFGPVALAEAVAGAAPPDALATVDAGAHFLAVMPFWPATEPLRLLISNGLATMGFALPAAIAAALARPGQPVVCLVGDGGLAMTLAELETLARLQLPVTVVVFDDAALSLIEIKQRPGQGGAGAVRFHPVDYAAVAAAMRLDAAVVTTTTELAAVLHAGWGRPRLVDARIDPSSYPALMAATRG